MSSKIYDATTGKFIDKKKKKGTYFDTTTGKIERYIEEPEEIAPVKTTKKKERTWFDLGAFEDGYDFGDVTKTLLGTSKNITENLYEGAIGIGEKAIDTGAYGVGYVGGLFGNDKLQSDMQKFIEKDLIDEEKIAKYASWTNPTALVNQLIVGDKADEYTVLGDKSQSLVQSAGQLGATFGLQMVGVPWWLTTGSASFGGEVEQAFKQGATYGEAGFSGLVSAGAEILTEKISGGISFGGKTLDTGLKKLIGEKITNKTVSTLAKFGLDAVGEGGEEVLTEVLQNVGRKLSYEDEKTWNELLTSEEAMDSYLESFIGGAVLGGGMSAGKVARSIKTGRDYDTGYTQNEQKVIDTEINNRTTEIKKQKAVESRINDIINEREKTFGTLDAEKKKIIKENVMKQLDNGEIDYDSTELSKKELSKIQEEVENDLKKGNLDIETIESTLSSDKVAQIKALNEQLSKTTNEQQKAEIQAKINEITNAKNNALKGMLSKDIYLQNSYREANLRKEKFAYEVQETDSEYRKTLAEEFENKANNTTKSHETFEMLAKLSEDRQTQYHITNNTELAELGYDVEGKDVNGLVRVNEDGTSRVLINIDSNKALNRIVGHETTHLLEGTKEYTELQQMVKEYATTKGDYNRLYKEFTKLYDGTNANIEAEITSELVGDYLFTDTDFVNNLSVQKPNIFQKIYNEIKHLYKMATAGSKEARQLEKVKKAFEDAYRANVSNSVETDTKYSITDNKGRELTKEQQEYFKDSKVRDDNGNLKIVYHGSNVTDITVFKKDKFGDVGINFLTDDPDIADTYRKKSGRRYEFYADIKNPLVIDGEGKNWNDILVGDNPVAEKMYNSLTESEKTYLTDLAKKMNDTYSREDAIEGFYQRINAYDEGLYDRLSEVTGIRGKIFDAALNDWSDTYAKDLLGKRKNTNQLVREAYDSGNYDGVIFENIVDRGMNFHKAIGERVSNVYVTFNSNQIKNIDNTNPTSNEDIRYSLSESGLKDIADEFGGGKNYWEANLYDKDLYGAVYYLKHENSVKRKFKELNNINVEPVYKDIELKGIGSQDENIQRFIKENNLNVVDLANNQELLDKFYELEHEAIKKQFNVDDTEANEIFSQWKDYFERQKGFNETLWPLKRFENDFKNIIEGNTKTIDNIETAKLERQLVDDNPEFEKYVTKYAEKLFSEKVEYDAEDVMEEAKYQHGTTDNFEVGAYMTTDGSLLNFNYGGYRDDHRTISVYGLDMKEFMDYGAIRMQPESPGFEMQIEPTNEQYDKLYDYIDYIKSTRKSDDTIRIDIDKGKSYDNATYDINTPTSKIISDLKQYWKTGSFPKQSDFAQFRYSLSKEGEQIAPVRGDVFGSDIKLQVEEAIAPLKEEIAELKEELASTVEETPVANDSNAQVKEENAPIKQQLAENSVAEEKTSRVEQQTAQILDERPTPKNKEKKLKAIATVNLIDKGYYISKLARQTDNRQLDALWDNTLLSNAQAQEVIGEGRFKFNEDTKSYEKVGDSVYEIFEGLETTDKVKDFNEYMYHKLNIERMSLEDNAQLRMKTLRETTLKGYADEDIDAISRKRLKEDAEQEMIDLVNAAKEYKNLSEVKNKPVFGDSIDANKSIEIVNKIEQNNPEFSDYAKKVYDYESGTYSDLSLLVESGILSQEDANYYRNKYESYVPIMRDVDAGMMENQIFGKRVSVGKVVKSAKGGTQNIIPLKDAMAIKTMLIQRAANMNKLGLELMNTLNPTVESESVTTENIIDDINGNKDLLQEGTNGKAPTMTVYEHGVKHTFEIPQEIYEALKPNYDSNSKITIKPLNAFSNFKRNVLTQYNPFFMVTNMIKDAQDVLINSQHPATTYKSIPEAIAQLTSKGYWYKEMQSQGLFQDTYYDNQGGFDTTKKGIAKLGEFYPLKKIAEINDFIERVPRMAEYIASRKAGRSVEVSSLDASRVTTNFKAGGDWTKFFNRNGATFLNASVQGALQQVRNVQEAHQKGLKGYMALATKFAIAALPAILLNNLIWDDDDEYEELSDYIKDNYYIIGKYGDGQFIRIPKGRMTAVIQKGIEEMQNLVTGDDEVDLKSYLELVVNNLAPSNPVENNIFSPFINTKLFNNDDPGKTWYGEDLVPTRLQSKPAAEQYDETTDEFSKWLGKKLNLSPIKINNLIDQNTGVIGDLLLPMMTAEAKTKNDNPIAAGIEDKFTADVVFDNKYSTDFYSVKENLAKKSNSYEATDEDILKTKYMNSKQAQMNDIYAEIRNVQNSDLDKKTKYAKVRELRKQLNDIAENSLNSYNKVNIESSYSKVGEIEFRKNDSGEWEKITSKQLEKQNEATNKFGISANYYWEHKKEYDYAVEYPNKYAVISQIDTYDNYIMYDENIENIKKQYKTSDNMTSKQKTALSKQRKAAVQQYIESLNLNVPQKIMLEKMAGGYSIKGYEEYMYGFIESLNMTAKEKQALHKELFN